jgi:uncharacterized integral membrane protein
MGGDNKMQWYIVLGSLFIMVIAIFAYQNPQEVSLRFIVWQMPAISLVLLIFTTTALGALTTLLFSLAKQLTQSMRIRELQRNVKQLEKQLADKAGQPLANDLPMDKKS